MEKHLLVPFKFDHTKPKRLGFGHGGALKFSEECSSMNKWRFPKIGVPQNGWFIMENPIKMDDLGVPLFFGNTQMKVGRALSLWDGLLIMSELWNFTVLSNWITWRSRGKNRTSFKPPPSCQMSVMHYFTNEIPKSPQKWHQKESWLFLCGGFNKLSLHR